MFKMDKQIRKDPYYRQCAVNLPKENSDMVQVFLSPRQRGASTPRIFVPVYDGRPPSLSPLTTRIIGGTRNDVVDISRADSWLELQDLAPPRLYYGTGRRA